MKNEPISGWFETLLAGAPPDLKAAESWKIGQVLVTRESWGWELRHEQDRAIAFHLLEEILSSDLRLWSNKTESGAFRPLKSAPTLRAGWVLKTDSDTGLEQALNILYPGALADWNAARQPNPPVTHYREYVGRQSGMYRITAMLTDAQAANVTLATCDVRCCIKRRYWTVPGLEADEADRKSIIPCLEPCAILLDAARKTAKQVQKRD